MCHKIAAMTLIMVKKIQILTSLRVLLMEGYRIMNNFLLLTLLQKNGKQGIAFHT